ncbi:MAG: hypothetical protein KBB90_07500, partial [Spirochaetia bacterium]|nr:hypothetical protein [Spirochaetia bacterium]
VLPKGGRVGRRQAFLFNHHYYLPSPPSGFPSPMRQLIPDLYPRSHKLNFLNFPCAFWKPGL